MRVIAQQHFAWHRSLLPAFAAIACCDIAMGLTFQLLPLLMERRHVPAWVMGLNAAMSPIGAVIAGSFLPRLVAFIGSKRLVYAATTALVLSLLGFKLTSNITVWFAIRLVLGMAAGSLFSIGEAWTLSSAEKGMRGRVMGLYTSVLGVTFAIGPVIVPFTGIDGWLPWLIGIGCVSVSLLPLALGNVNETDFRTMGAGFLGFVNRAPLLLFTVICCTIFDAILMSFFSIFGLRSGLPLSTVSWLLAVSIISNSLTQFAVGWLADKWSRTAVTIGSAAITAVLSVGMIWTITNWLIWPLILVLGTTAFAIYTVALTILGDRFDGSDLIAGSGAFATMWGVGGVIGPPIAGAALDVFGVNSIPLSLATIYIILLLGLIVSRGRLVRERDRA
jgi:MFS family permease